MANKMKTHKGAAKRFKKSANGKIMRKKAYKGHILGKKTPKRKRNLRKGGKVEDCDKKRVNKQIPYK
mgnify:FL=1